MRASTHTRSQKGPTENRSSCRHRPGDEHDEKRKIKTDEQARKTTDKEEKKLFFLPSGSANAARLRIPRRWTSPRPHRLQG